MSLLRIATVVLGIGMGSQAFASPNLTRASEFLLFLFAGECFLTYFVVRVTFRLSASGARVPRMARFCVGLLVFVLTPFIAKGVNTLIPALPHALYYLLVCPACVIVMGVVAARLAIKIYRTKS